MKDFNTFTSENKSQANADFDFSNPLQAFAKLASNYEGKSADEIMLAIIKQAEVNRKNGKLTDSEIDSFSSTVAPFLNPTQRKTLESVIERIKSIK